MARTRSKAVAKPPGPRNSEIKLDPWPRQKQAIETEATELVFGGASEGGKSHYLRTALIKWCTEIPGLQCVIIRKYYADVIRNHMEGENNFRIMLAPWIQDKLVTITENQVRFNFNKSLITLLQCRTQEDFDKAQGLTKHVLAWEEATQIPEKYLNDIRGWVRMSNEMKATIPAHMRHCFPRIIYTCNPIGESVGYFRREFIEAREPFKIEKVGAFTRQFIPSLITDNPSADAVAQRERLTSMHSKAMAEALITGNWNVIVGAYYPEFSPQEHVVEPFNIPAHWTRYCSMDWGACGEGDPFVIHWWAVSDGSIPRFPRDSLVCYREWSGKGLPKVTVENIAAGILHREAKDPEILSRVAGGDILEQRGTGPSIFEIFRSAGIFFQRADMRRVSGWQQLRSRLVGRLGVPNIFFFSSCHHAIETIPACQADDKDPNDVMAGDDHALDSVRYQCMARPITTESRVIQPPKGIHEMTLQQLLKAERRYARA